MTENDYVVLAGLAFFMVSILINCSTGKAAQKRRFNASRRAAAIRLISGVSS